MDIPPTFSVIIPVYNRADLLATAIASIRAQIFQDLEIVVVDDGSTDNVEDTLRAIGEHRVNYVRQPNRGASAARNRGLDTARGRFAAFLDSDDQFLPCHLEQAWRALVGTRDTAFYAPIIALRAQGVAVVKPPRPLRPGENMAAYLMSDRGFVQTSGLVVPRQMAARVRYREDAGFGDDTDFAVRLQLAGCAFTMGKLPGALWSDGVAQLRLSAAGVVDHALPWLEDLKPLIPMAAYDGYRGWHLAKALFRRQPLAALGLYLRALRSGSYRPWLALTVLCQIVLPSMAYRNLANAVIRLRHADRALESGRTSVALGVSPRTRSAND